MSEKTLNTSSNALVFDCNDEKFIRFESLAISTDPKRNLNLSEKANQLKKYITDLMSTAETKKDILNLILDSCDKCILIEEEKKGGFNDLKKSEPIFKILIGVYDQCLEAIREKDMSERTPLKSLFKFIELLDFSNLSKDGKGRNSFSYGEVLSLTKSFFDNFDPKIYGYNPLQHAKKLLDYAQIDPITPSSEISDFGFELNGYLVNLFWNFVIAYMDFHPRETDDPLDPKKFESVDAISNLKISYFYNFSLSEFFNLDSSALERFLCYYEFGLKDFGKKKVYDILNSEIRDRKDFRDLKISALLERNVGEVVDLNACKAIFYSKYFEKDNVFDSAKNGLGPKLRDFLGYEVKRYFNSSLEYPYIDSPTELKNINTELKKIGEVILHDAIINGIKKTVYRRRKIVAAMNRLIKLISDWKSKTKEGNKITKKGKQTLVSCIASYCFKKCLSNQKITFKDKLLLFGHSYLLEKDKKDSFYKLKENSNSGDINRLLCFVALHPREIRRGNVLDGVEGHYPRKYISLYIPKGFFEVNESMLTEQDKSDLEVILKLDFIKPSGNIDMLMRETMLAGLCYNTHNLNAYYLRMGFKDPVWSIYRRMESFITYEMQERTIDKFKNNYSKEGKIVFNLYNPGECFSFFFYFGYIRDDQKKYKDLYQMLERKDAEKLFKYNEDQILMFEADGAETITAANIAKYLDLSAFGGNAIYCLKDQYMNVKAIELLLDNVDAFKIAFDALPEYKKKLSYSQFMKIPESRRIEFAWYLDESQNEIIRKPNEQDKETSQNEILGKKTKRSNRKTNPKLKPANKKRREK